jgi:hypothetical protein
MAVGAEVGAEFSGRSRTPRADAPRLRGADALSRPMPDPRGARTPRAEGRRATPPTAPSSKNAYRPPPRSRVFKARIGGGLLAAIAAYCAIAVSSPDGAIAGAVAYPLVDVLGWLALPWCVAVIAAGAAAAAGPIAWRRTVATRGIGVVLLLTGLAVATSSREPASSTDRFLDASAGSGMLGVGLRTTLQSMFGSAGVTAISILATILGAVLLAGVPRAWWRQLGEWIASGARWAATDGGQLALSSGSAAARAIVVVLVASAEGVGHFLGTAAVASGHAVARVWRTLTAPRPVQSRDGGFADDWQSSQPSQIAETAPLRVRRPADGETTSVGTTTGNGEGPVATPKPTTTGKSIRAITVATGGSDHELIGPVSAASPRPGTPLEWRLPPVTMLSESAAQQLGDAEIAEKASTIERTLGSFNIPVTVREARVGPTVTQFSLVPGEGVPVKAIKRFEYDLQLRLAAKTLRIELPVPGRPFVGIEIPNDRAASVGLREVLESREFVEHKGRLRVGLGRDVDGRPRVGDLARMPHVLIAGQTGAGKSVCLNTIIASLLCYCRPNELNLLMIDPKQVELAEYEGIPHLRYPVVTDLAEAGKLLLWVCEEMERRYTLLSKAGYRHLDAYNRSLGSPAEDAPAPQPTDKSRHANPDAKPLPYIVLVIDELADLMMFAPDDVEPAICRLTAKARAVGIHLVVATQRPSVNVVTGLIKANIPSRVAFAVASQTDSRVILDTGGAEALLGKGDMLYLPYDQGRPVRVQGAWVSDEELSALVKHWKAQGSPNYVSKDEIDSLALRDEEAAAEKDHARTALLDRAIEAMRSTNSVSVSFLQRKLGIGYPKAAKLMDDLEDAGHVELDETTGRTYRVINRGGADDDADELVMPMAIGRRGRGGRR